LIQKSEYESPATEYERRSVFTTLLKDLLPNTTYMFRVFEPSWNKSLHKVYSYKTFDLNNIRLVAGGDIGNNILATKMNEQTVSKLNADLILVGGDIAYDNNIPTCYRSWDYLLNRVPHYRFDSKTNSTRVVPLLFAAGNHDLGVNSYGQATIRHDIYEPVFKHWFPQNTEDGEVPSLSARRSYFSHNIGEKVVILSLDVGYEASMEHAQK
jgi:hypothetical protein